MTRREIAKLACKVIALWLFAQAATMAFYLLGGLFGLIMLLFGVYGASQGFVYMMGTLPALGPLIVGVILWKRADRIAPHIADDNPSPVTRDDLSYPLILRLAVIVVGLFLLIPGFQGIVRQMGILLIDPGSAKLFFSDTQWLIETAAVVLGLALACWFILGSRGVLRLIQSLQKYREKPLTDDEDQSESSG